MYKVVIVDDEPWILKGLKKKVSEFACHFQVVGTAENAVDAFQKIKVYRPDIAIVDIVMPEISGLELIKRTINDNLSVLFIIITGFEDFKFAKQAISLGALEYILKPVKMCDLKNALYKAKILLDKQRDYHLLKKNIENIKFMDSIDIKDAYDIQSYLHFNNVYGNYAAVSAINRGDLEYSFNNCEVSALFCEPDRYTYFISFENFDDLLGRIRNSLNNGTSYAGISRVHKHIEEIKKAFRESQVALYNCLLNQNTRIYCYNQTESNERLQEIKHVLTVLSKESKLSRAAISSILDDLITFIDEGTVRAEDIEVIYDPLITVLREYFIDLNKEFYLPDFSSLIKKFYCIKDILRNTRETITRSHIALDDQFLNPLLQEVINYLEVNITRDITLKELAHTFHINESYLSQLFRKETGKTFTQLRNDLRIDLARQKLVSTNLSISEICDMCGFNDYFHFNKVFKKATGVTPSSYRKLVKYEN
ncbi:MAG: AraC family transcriptional regulator [Clostridiaceae bacterium]|nr:AraC family transcriptional regulator [Clostridiaceae bacterium]